MWYEFMFTNNVVFMIFAGVCACFVGLIFHLHAYVHKLGTSKPTKIKIVTTEEECDIVVDELIRCSKQESALGFDCEWVTNNVGESKGHRKPVALVQLAARNGYCALFRLNLLKCVPNSLKAILENSEIYKLGVGTLNDAKYLASDYSLAVRGTLDIRHIAKNSGYEPGGLDNLARNHLRVALDKHWTIRASDWNAQTLTQRQILYAANDALVAIRVFEKLLQGPRAAIPFLRKENIWKNVKMTLKRYADLAFTAKPKSADCDSNGLNKNSVRQKKYSVSVRSKPLYQNCFMLAPDGELLCTCEDKKALWYVSKGLADEVKSDPLTVKLRFEPAGRAVGEVGRYYQLEKQNKCVVCGRDNSYIRKNVVPREYRKYFPEIMKDHSSHDVVLLCLSCHQRSNMSDQQVRYRLATQCDAPLMHSKQMNKDKYIEDADAKGVKSAARALLQDRKKNNLPRERRKHLEQIVLKHYPDQRETTEDMLIECCNIKVLYENENYESHGQKVVERYTQEVGGLLSLEKIWREHFLETMQPQHLPELWCVNHNEERLKIRVNEGRINPDDMRVVGLE